MKHLTVLISVSLITSEFEGFFTHLLAPRVFKSINCILILLVCFCAWVILFIAFLKFFIFGFYLRPIFYLFKNAILMNRCLILMSSNLSIFFLLLVVIKSYLRNCLLPHGHKISSS